MSLEHEIKEALMRRSGDVREKPAAFDAVEDKVRRSHHRRLTAATAFGVAAIVAAVIAVPRFIATTETEPIPFGGTPPASEEPTPVPPVTEDLATYRNQRDGYQLRFPAPWRVAGFEGSVELLPSGQIGLAAGEDTFAVELFLFPGEAYDAPSDFFGDARFEPADEVAGRPTVRYEADENTTFYRVDWTDVCGYCDEAATLQIQVFGSTDELWESYSEDAGRIVESVETLANAEYPTGRVHTRHGVVTDRVAYDEFTTTLVDFLDARVDGVGTDRWYSGDLPEGFINSYRILQRVDADANSLEFSVEVIEDGSAIPETIGVGPVGSDMGIRFVVRS